MSLLSRKPTPMLDCRRSLIAAQTFASKINVPISDAALEAPSRSGRAQFFKPTFSNGANEVFGGALIFSSSSTAS